MDARTAQNLVAARCPTALEGAELSALEIGDLKTMKSLFAIVSALVCLAAANAQNVTGRWTGNFSTADNGLQIELALNQSGSTVTG